MYDIDPNNISKLRKDIQETLKIKEDSVYNEDEENISSIGSCNTSCTTSCTACFGSCLGICSTTCVGTCSASSTSESVITGISHEEYINEINNGIDNIREIINIPTINGVPYDENPKQSIFKRLAIWWDNLLYK